MNATHCSSRQTNTPGMSPSMMRVKIVAMPAIYSPAVPDDAVPEAAATDATATDAIPADTAPTVDSIWTVPNLFTLLRLLCLPLFLWLLFGLPSRQAAAWVLGGLGA